MVTPNDAFTLLKRNRIQYEQLAGMTEAAFRRDDLEGVLATATVAANSAWLAPIEFLSDPKLESLIAQSARSGGELRVDVTRDVGRILHVLSEGYVTGGHTRLAYRWMQRDPRAADVALTNQHGEIPSKLTEAARACHGRVYDLREASTSLTGRAIALRRLMDRADLVVLHVHPYDAVAVAAANLPGTRPPIIFEDHADHAFWLGLMGGDVFANARTVGQRVAEELRGVRRERIGLLPLPLDPATSRVRRDQVRARLRLGPRDVLAVSVASAHKMSPVWGESFERLLTPALEAYPNLVVLLVGPPPDSGWNSALARFPRRMFQLGVQTDLDPLYAAADIYLDSFPVSGPTSILEAASFGLPLLRPPAYEGHLQVFQSNSPGLEGSGEVPKSRAEWLRTLGQLIERPHLRREAGRQAQRSVLASHQGKNWSAALEELYAQARSVGPGSLDEYGDRIENAEYGSWLAPFMQQSGGGRFTPGFCTSPVGDALSPQLGCDIYIATNVGGDKKFSIRVGQDWNNHSTWVGRLAHLASRYPHLTVSLPLCGDDDGTGDRSVAELTEVFASVGLAIEHTGDFTLDPHEPARTPPMIETPLAFTAASLDLLEMYLSAPSWEQIDRLDSQR